MVVFDINSRNIYHRDLKPGNFLIKRDKNGNIYLYLNDFGIAKTSISDNGRITTSSGCYPGVIEYTPPEIFNAIKEKPDITKRDVWAIGVTAYQICT
jgi:serine/threonine protein kinase